ncbi:unnamed protein product [Chilo suppressalis]|uniref:F5/8 type C domain-containing protein n=1 Tax=Chilo suppressalis TaxID=168631 RepID=A0ABN8BAS7_CHISP|nr:unnamed protein product [Chilo suppressalis]
MVNQDRAKPKTLGSIIYFCKEDDYYAIYYDTGEQARLYILNSHVFRYYMSPKGAFTEYPEPLNPKDTAKIVVKNTADYGKKAFNESTLDSDDDSYIVNTHKIQLFFDKQTATMRIRDKRNSKTVLKESRSLSYYDYKSSQRLHQNKDEQFLGGGMQNGRFTHKGETINIVNTNNWIDGGVTSPNPFYWSSHGYGILRNTWQPGIYDFGTKSMHTIKTTHKGEDFDAFFLINSQPKDILNDYYELTGRPIFMPEYAFYEAHLNAFNRDYWVEVSADTPRAILFEDGKYYKCYQPKDMGDKKGILESLNGENNNYQFSARGMIDRYKRHDMPLGFFVPNDGYGCGYGQTDSLDGDIENLKEFADYSRSHGVEVALWTESNLHPADPNHPKKGERDLGKEVAVAGVVALKCDVAWIGSGYSFGLTAVEDATKIFVKHTRRNTRPMIIMVDGWAGTQRYSSIWSGDQKGGQWEYIRFHIPTYIGSGLSGQPIVGSDLDGIYAGGVKAVNVRDFQWKTFTPLQLNMDGWGDKAKTPFSYDDEATNINRAYLKLKSMLMPYNYTIGHQSTEGLPMVRAMLLEFPKDTVAYTTIVQYQFMWGPNILVAPIYNEDTIDGISVRNVIYLPDKNTIWIDFFTGQRYKGGIILNNFRCPLWKIPVFVRSGAIIPMVNSNNNPYEIKRDNRILTLYPDGKSNFEIYEDDGITADYVEGLCGKTLITMVGPKSYEKDTLYIYIGKTNGFYTGMVKHRKTLFQIKTSEKPDKIRVAINGNDLRMIEAHTKKQFEENDNVYFFNDDFVINPYLISLGGECLQQTFILIKIASTDVTESEIQVKISGYTSAGQVFGETKETDSINKPQEFEAPENKITPTSITLKWNLTPGAAYYEIDKDGNVYTNVIGNSFTFAELKNESKHSFKIRSSSGFEVSEWSETVEAITKESPYKNTLKGVKVSCNIPCKSSHEVCKLTDGDLSCMWHTDWGEEGKAKPEEGKYLTLTFDLGEIRAIEKVDYVPREDGGNGTFLELQYRFSDDGVKWSDYSNTVVFPHDETIKSMTLGRKFRYMELKVLKTVGCFGSGKQILFYPKS